MAATPPRLFRLLLAFISVALALQALALAVHAQASSDTTTPLAFSERDGDVPDQYRGDLWRGVTVTAVLEYDVKFSRTGDDELKDAEVKMVLPDGLELRAWVGLGNDNVILALYKGSVKVREWELARQDCGLLGCNEAKGTVTVELKVDCYGQAEIVAMGYTLQAPSIVPEDRAVKVFSDNDVVIADVDDSGCGQPPPDASTPPPQPLEAGDGYRWLALALAGAGALGLAYVAMSRGGRR